MIGKVDLFLEFATTSKDFFILLTITSLNVMYYSFTSAYKTRTPINMKNLPLVRPVNGHSVYIVLVSLILQCVMNGHMT